MPGKGSGGGGGTKKPAASLNIIYGTDDPTVVDYIALDATILDPSTDNDDEIWGYAGIDLIDAAGGNDTVYGGTENDVIFGSAGDDTLYGDEGDDIIDGGADNDTIFGGAGADEIIGGDGNDTIDAGDGDDLIIGGNGSDSIDGGAGFDTVAYGGILGTDYIRTDIFGKGKNKDVVVAVEIFKVASGDTDTLTNVEDIIFLSPVVTETDLAQTQFDQSVTFDVLANDQQLGYGLGENLVITDILDVQIDIFPQDGVNDVDLIPDGATLADFASGVILADGSILTLNPDDTLTWDPNGQYDIEPADTPIITFWYQAEGLNGEVAYGEVDIIVTYPPDPPVPGSVIDFDGMVESLFWHVETADNVYLVSQLTTAYPEFPYESRDVGATTYNYDDGLTNGDADEEWRVWSDADGTTHELNVLREDYFEFNVASIKFTGFDAGEEVTIAYSTAPDDGATTYQEYTITNADLQADGTYILTDGTGIGQLSVIAGAGDSVFVDDIIIG